MKIGVIVDSFRVSFEEGVLKAAAVGADGIQAYATTGAFSPQNLNAAKRREALDYVRSNGLVFSALCGDFGGHGFMHEDENANRIERSKRIIDMALELDCKVVTTHIGVIPVDRNNSRYDIMQRACYKLGEYAEKCGAFFAVETGPEPAATLARFIKELGVKGVAVNLDPANLAMVIGEDSVEAAKILGPLSVHTHAKDGILLKKEDPEIIYGLVKHDEMGERPEYFREVVLGTGDVHFEKYLPALKASGYNGFLTIEREAGDVPEKDIRIAVEFLRKHIADLKL